MSTTFELYPSITHISDRFRGVLLDAYGVFWINNDLGLIPGSKEVMEKLVSSGKIVGILSNSTQLAAKEINKLKLHGLVQEKHFHFLITSGEVARSIFLNEKLPFETPRNSYFLFGGVHPKHNSHQAIFEGTKYTETSRIDKADFLYIIVPHVNGADQEDIEIFREEIKKVKAKNLPMVCPNPDQFASDGNPTRTVVRQGSIAKMYEELGGQVFYIGKPHNKAYNVAMKHFNPYAIDKPADVIMVGDTPETDIRGARSFGMSSALLTETGIMGDRVRNLGLEKALNALPSNDCPAYLVGRL